MARKKHEMNITGRTVIVGAGISGQWAAELILSHGGKVVFADQKTKDALKDAMERFKGRNVVWHTGNDAGNAFCGADLVVLSPGIPDSFPGLTAAKKSGITVTGEMEMAASLADVPICAVTGSNGKTTTTGLVGHICRKLKFPVFVGGNIGEPLSRHIVEGKKVKAVVLELSSYQLETVEKFHASAAGILNVSPDHLDRYEDMAEYFRVKTNIFINQTAENLAVMNEDDVLLNHKTTVARRFGFSRNKAPEFGAWIRRGDIVVVDNGRTLAHRPWADFKLVGVHNQENVMAAVGLAMGLGLDAQKALDAATSFLPEKHRLELVGEYCDVQYYDDSKGTNVGAVRKALESFKKPIVLIAGGQGKGQNFRFLYKPVKAKVKHLILIGEDQNKMEQDLTGAAPISKADSMAEAVRKAKAAAAKGTVVLLSPACASFDMFSDYRQRGEAFAREVKKQNS